MAPARATKIEVYYDISSANAYLTFVTLVRYQHAWNLNLDLHPVSQAKIMDATGAKDFPVMPIKAVYQDRDVVRTAQRWGLDIRKPPGFPLGDITHNVVAFLRVLKQVESVEVLIECTQLLFEEYHSVHTPVTSPNFLDCLASSTTTPRSGPLSKTRLQELVTLSQSPENNAAVQTDVDDVVAKYGTFLTPWMVAHRLPVDDRTPAERAKSPAPSTEYQSFFGVERVEALGYYLGPEYVWRGPWPDGRERFRPSATGYPGLPIELSAEGGGGLASKSRL